MTRHGSTGAAQAQSRQALAAAERYLAKGDLGRANDALQQVLATDPRNLQALNLFGIVALGSGDHARAAEVLRHVLTIDDRHADAHSNLGAALLGLGRTAEGEASLRRAVGLRGSHPMANYNLGLIALEAGRFQEAARHLGRTVRAEPRNVEALNLCGLAEAGAGDSQAAKRMFVKAHRIAPRNPHVAANLARVLIDTGESSRAAEMYGDLLRDRPDDAGLLFNLGVALDRSGRNRDAVAAYRRALDIDPELLDARSNLGIVLARMGRLDESMAELEVVAGARPDDPYAQLNLAENHRQLGEAETAVAICRDVLAHHPDHDDTYRTLIAALRDAGRFDQARALLADLRARRPDSTVAIFLLATDRSATPTDADIADIEAAAERSDIEDRDREALLFGLGNFHLKRGDHDRSFAFFARANARASAWRGRAQDERAIVDDRIAVFSADRLRAGPVAGSSDDARPVFIVGMPRSGTSLVEQIIASHPDAAGAGELTTITSIAADLPDRLGSASPYPACISDVTPAALAEISETYSRRISRVSRKASRITDKMPTNYLELGLIALMFPNARIVHCRRDPRSTALSIYFHDFDGDHPYAYDLNRIGLRHHHYLRMMDHWREVLPLPLLDVDYEDLVDDVEAGSRRLLEFCGLDWDDRVLRFYETDRVVRTLSKWEVRRPIYRDSLSPWKPFEAHLAPLEQGLAGRSA